MKISSVEGFWELTSVRVQSGDEPWVEEKVLSGSVSFNQDRLVYLSRTTELVFGFTGQYRIEDHRMTVRIETSTFEHLEGTLLERDVTVLNNIDLLLSGIEVETCRRIELRFRRFR